MKRHPPPALRALQAALAAGLLMLSACGPGTGGTGVAPGYLDAAGATADPVCGASWAADLRCPAPQDGLAPQLWPGTSHVQFASALIEPDVVAVLEGNRITLHGGCPRQDFVGDWGLLPTGERMFFGGWVGPEQVGPVAARLTANGVDGAGAPALVIELRDASDRTVLGPLTLQQVEGADIAARPCQ